jgi:hypothetical protein
MLSYSQRGTVTGLSYTDVNAQLLALHLLAVIAAVCVVLFLVNIRFRGWLLPAAGVGILARGLRRAVGAYPAVIQRLQVDPQELPRERRVHRAQPRDDALSPSGSTTWRPRAVPGLRVASVRTDAEVVSNAARSRRSACGTRDAAEHLPAAAGAAALLRLPDVDVDRYMIDQEGDPRSSRS